jgi:hypothetical protein
MRDEMYLVDAKKPVSFLANAKDMHKLEQLVKRLKKQDKGVSVSGLIRYYIKEGLKQSSKASKE